MNVIQTHIPGVLIIEPRVFKDSRGYFFESFSQREFDDKVTPILGHSIHFVQDNESMSSYGVMRGLHYQAGQVTAGQVTGHCPAYSSTLIHNHKYQKNYISRQDSV